VHLIEGTDREASLPGEERLDGPQPCATITDPKRPADQNHSLAGVTAWTTPLSTLTHRVPKVCITGRGGRSPAVIIRDNSSPL
jgi:hypothetical protein